MSVHRRLVAILGAALIVAGTATVGAQQRPDSGRASATPRASRRSARHPEVRLNGRRLASVVVERTDGRAEILVPVSAIVAAVDGAPPDTTDGTPPRLRVAGGKLYAVAEGGCARCTVRVRRAVLLSARIRSVGGVPHLPLDDLVHAFEGRLETDDEAGVYTIYAGTCTWCMLEPSTR